jgi:hypothetical protein
MILFLNHYILLSANYHVDAFNRAASAPHFIDIPLSLHRDMKTLRREFPAQCSAGVHPQE